MRAAIADTSGLVALVQSKGPTHAAAILAADTYADDKVRILVPSEVFAETINILGKKVSNAIARRRRTPPSMPSSWPGRIVKQLG